MFFNNCSGCLQVPVPVQYWSPYMAPVKKSSFHIADILRHHMTNSVPQMCHDVRKSTDVKYADFSTTQKRSEIKRMREVECVTRSVKHFRRSPTSEKDIVKTTKDRHNVRCSLPSALAPLQALCSDGVASYNDRSGEAEKQHSERINSNSSLKFGINRILSDDFGKEKTEKENDPENEDCLQDRICDCSDYRRMAYSTYALSAVHAIQPPRYPSSSPDSDTLPGPYSVLNTEVNGGGHSKRKRSWSRAVFSNLQRKGLEKRFEVQKYVTKPDRRQLAAMLGLTDAQVKVWFQNRRMKWRHTSQQQQQTDEEKDTNNDSREDEMDTGETVTDMDEKL